MYRLSDLDSLGDHAMIWAVLDIGFAGKFLCCRGIAFGDEVLHDQIVDVSETSCQSSLR